MELSLASIFLIFTGTSIGCAFFAAAAMFGVTSLYGYMTQRDLSAIGSFLIMGLIGVVIASIVNIFLGSSALQCVVSIVGIIVFVGLTAWDTQSIKEQYADNFDLESKQKLAVIDWRAGRMSSGPSRTLRRQSPSSQLLLLELGGRVPI